MQALTVDRPQYDTTAGRQNTCAAPCQLPNHRLFDIAKPLFTFALEVLTYGATQTLLNHMIRIRKRKLQSPGKLTPDGLFARAGQANERYQWSNTQLMQGHGAANVYVFAPAGVVTVIPT